MALERWVYIALFLLVLWLLSAWKRKGRAGEEDELEGESLFELESDLEADFDEERSAAVLHGLEREERVARYLEMSCGA